MIVKRIEYSGNFCRQLKKLPEIIIKRAIQSENLFKANPLHPGLRLHRLQGKLKECWSISITLDYRIIFKRMADGVIIFISIGRHAIYER